MMYPTLSSLLVLHLAGPSDIAWRTLPEALAEAQAEGRPTLVYVQAAWCGPCRRLKRDTFADPGA